MCEQVIHTFKNDFTRCAIPIEGLCNYLIPVIARTGVKGCYLTSMQVHSPFLYMGAQQLGLILRYLKLKHFVTSFHSLVWIFYCEVNDTFLSKLLRLLVCLLNDFGRNLHFVGNY